MPKIPLKSRKVTYLYGFNRNTIDHSSQFLFQTYGTKAGDGIMKWDTLDEEPCSLSRTVAVVGDRWTLLILRECFLRVRRFEAFQSSLQITRHLLSERLKKLVRFGILRRVPYSEAPKRYEYILTQKGLDLYPIIMAMVHWGDSHMGDERGRPLLHEHKTCGKLFDPVMVCSECGEPLHAKQVHVHAGPGRRGADAA